MQMQDKYFELDLSPTQLRTYTAHFNRSKSCLEHYAFNFNFPLNFVPMLKPKTFLASPSPMILGKKGSPAFNEEDKLNLYEGYR